MTKEELKAYLVDRCDYTAAMVNDMESDELFEAILQWEGICGFSESIKNWTDAAFGTNLKHENYLKSTKSLLITTEGEVREIEPADEEHFSLEEMYHHIGCSIIENVYLPENRIMVCDEEGFLKKDKKVNWKATKILTDVIMEKFPDRYPMFIFGNVILMDEYRQL